ncbi:MAG: hypothetical protein WAZ94_07585 [Phycisphaerales bacterium]
MPDPAPKPRSTPKRSLRGVSAGGLADLAETREAFWQNVVREMLTSLSAIYAQGRSDDPEHAAMFDGRIAIITTRGERIGIGAVSPVFACSVMDMPGARGLAHDVECTVFQIETPEGEVFTLPLQEIRAIHALSHDLIEEINSASRERDGGEMPFGFEAFTSLARSRREETWAPFFIGPDFPQQPGPSA